MKKCANCGKEFELGKFNKRQRYCTTKCQQIDYCFNHKGQQACRDAQRKFLPKVMVGHKICGKCGVDKPILEYTHKSSSRDAHEGQCKDCRHTYKKQYDAQPYNKTHKQHTEHQRYLINKPRIGAQKRAYKYNRYHTDTNYRLAHVLRSRLRSAIVGGFKAGSAIRDLGCTVDFCRKHLEFKFQLGWTWENYGEIWEIDHVVPLSFFDLTDPEQLKRACHYTNLQPISLKEHIQKTTKDLKGIAI